MRSLQRRVDDLERRLAALEQPARLTSSCGKLGEPDRVSGGTIAHWCYPRGGHVTFTSGRVTSWSEPSR